MMKKRICLAILLVVAVLVSSSWAQVISVSAVTQPKARRSPFLRKEEVEGYLNYGQDEYKNYKEELDVDKRYDFLGNFLMEGYEIFVMTETRPALEEGDATQQGSYVTKHAYYSDWFNNLLISKDSYRGWSTMLTVGDYIRTKFTSFTLKMARFNGVRWDASSTKNKFSIVGTRGYPGNFSAPTGGASDEGATGTEMAPIYVFGAHWQTQLGDVLKLGASYVNQHRVNARLGSSDNTMRGTLPESMDSFYPDTLFIRVIDDSPNKTPNDGAAVFSVNIAVKTTKDTTITQWITASGTEVKKSDPRIFDTSTRSPKTGYWYVSGPDDYIEFGFPLSDWIAEGSAEACQITMVVANDYSIQVGHNYLKGTMEEPEQRRVPYETIVRADGEVQDFSNKERLSFDYGLTTGHAIYGVDFEANLIGLTIKGEYANNSIYSKFPFKRGKELTDESTAYFLNITKDMGPFKLGYEYFHVGPEFGGGFDTIRGGGRFYTDAQDYGAVDGSFPVEEFPLVEDNDDNDQWPDDDSHDFWSGSGQDSGVFPGLDEDNDGIPDDDRNSNGTPDYTEPFLMYYVDPTEFVYGDDLNNNGEIDVRENDNKPDYPYDRDTEGYHYFGTIEPIKSMFLTLGHYDMEQLVGRGTGVATYGKIEYFYNMPRFGELVIQHDTKRVKDTIPNDVYPVKIDPKSGDVYVDPYNTAGRDRLDYSNSMAHTSYIGTRYSQVPNLNITNNFLIKRNDMFDTVAGDDQVTKYTQVSKLDYTLNLGKLTIKPMIKYLGLRSKQRSSELEDKYVEKWYEVAPILRMNYKITAKSTLQFGQQGFGAGKALSNRVKNQVTGSSTPESLKRTISLVMLSNSSDYWGYKIAANVGFLRTIIDYDKEGKASDNYSQFFIKIVCGY